MNDPSPAPRAAGADRWNGVVERLLGWARRLSARRSRTAGLPALLAALALFAGSTALAIRALPDLDDGIRWWPLVLVGLLAWVGAVVNGAEFAASARLLGRRVGFPDALRVAIVATAANTLPIPGAIIVRTRALARLGETHLDALRATAVVGLAMVGASFSLAGGLQAGFGPRRLAGTAMLAFGVVVLAAVHRVVGTRRGGGRTRLFWWLVLVELASVALKALTLGLAVHAIGFSASPSQLAAMSISYVIALAIGVFPAGLGITELLVGLISPGVGIDAAVGVLATSVRRVTELVAFSGLAIVFALREGARTRAAAAAAGDGRAAG